MKQCIICDSFLKDQNELFMTTHYICGANCAVYYLQCWDWNKKDINIDMLNEIRKEIIGIDGLMGYEVDKRIDREES